jgi:hypothetical protein
MAVIDFDVIFILLINFHFKISCLYFNLLINKFLHISLDENKFE